ncbi:MAG: MerR family transcriptional regulator [Deltaproteobacteria bacterium]|nr:MerR family transcriptional regulator [Deltaproteobacteria bacterium]
MYTVGKLAKEFGLSRSTLLYYDSIGLLQPAGRAKGDYRRYSPADARRLGQICLYRRAGLSLADIARVLDAPHSSLVAVLTDRLEQLNQDITRLREQQRFIIGILKNRALEGRLGVMNRQRWVQLLEASGFNQADMLRWHAEFERLAPAKHQEFLDFLCIPPEEAARIRRWARENPPEPAAGAGAESA